MLDDENLGPYINGVQWSLQGLAALFLGLRIYCKIWRHRQLWWDDYFLIASWVGLAVFLPTALSVNAQSQLMLLVNVILSSISIEHGYGRHTWELSKEDRVFNGRLSSGGMLCCVLAAACSKTSFAITLLRISEGYIRRVLWFLIVSMNLVLGTFIIIQFLMCRPISKRWDMTIPGDCWDPAVLAMYGLFSTVYAGVVDICLALLPWKIIMGTPLRNREKVGVAIAMSMGVFAGGVSFVKATQMVKMQTNDIMYDTVPIQIWGVAEIAVTIIATSIPILRALVKQVRDNSSEDRDTPSFVKRNSNGIHEVARHSTNSHQSSGNHSPVLSEVDQMNSVKSRIDNEIFGGVVSPGTRVLQQQTSTPSSYLNRLHVDSDSSRESNVETQSSLEVR